MLVIFLRHDSLKASSSWPADIISWPKGLISIYHDPKVSQSKDVIFMSCRQHFHDLRIHFAYDGPRYHSLRRHFSWS